LSVEKKKTSPFSAVATLLLFILLFAFFQYYGYDRLLYEFSRLYKGTSPTTRQNPPVIPQNYNLTRWAYYAMDWFDYKYSISEKLATRDQVFKLAAIYTFVETSVTYKADAPRNYAQSPYETLMLKTGDCEDYAILMASLCEYVGLDASVDIVSASYGSQTPSGLKQKNHAMCMIYFNLDENALQNALSNLRSIYQVTFTRFWWIKEPSRMIARDGYGFAYVNSKYSSGLWASLENWDSLKTYVRIDYSNEYLAN